MADPDREDLEQHLQSFLDQSVGPYRSWHRVNRDMIANWCDAMGDQNPIYRDEDAARAQGFSGIAAPPSMLQVWTMRDYNGDYAPGSASENPFAILTFLDGEDFPSVVAVNYQQTYQRYLVEGDQIYHRSYIAEISPQKETGLGVGYFITEISTFFDQHDEKIGEMHFRLFKYRPHPQKEMGAGSSEAAGGLQQIKRFRPIENHDSEHYWQGLRDGKLLIQKCDTCSTLRHPPSPMCPSCQSMDWSCIESKGKGIVHSYVVMHHPPIPPFDYPNAIGLIDLEDGVRIISQIVGIKPNDIDIGMSVRMTIDEVEDELFQPLFRPV